MFVISIYTTAIWELVKKPEALWRVLMAFPYVSFIITLIYRTVDRRLWIFHQCNIHLLKEQFLLYITYYTYFLKVIVTSARWLNKTFHVSFPRNNNDSTITHKQKYLCWSCGIQYQMPRNQGGVSPTCMLAVRHRDFGSSCESCSGLWASYKPSQPQARSPWRTVLDNHPWIKETLWEVSQREVSATTGAHTHTKKKYKFRCTRESECIWRRVQLYPYHTSYKTA